MTELSVDFMHADALRALPQLDPSRLYAVPDDGRFPVMVANVENVDWNWDPEWGGWDYSTRSRNVSYSVDGSNWLPALGYPPEPSGPYQFSYGNGVFMAVRGQALRSYDGINWEYCPGYLDLSVTGAYNGVDRTSFFNGEHWQHQLSSGGAGVDRYKLYATKTGSRLGYFSQSGAVSSLWFFDGGAFSEENGWAACFGVDSASEFSHNLCRSQMNSTGGFPAWTAVALPEDVYVHGMAQSVSAGMFAMLGQDVYDAEDVYIRTDLSVVYSEDGFYTRSLVWSGTDSADTRSYAGAPTFKAKRVPGSPIEYRYYMSRDNRVYFSTNCVDWQEVGGLTTCVWQIADMCEGPGPAVFYYTAESGQPSRVAVGDLGSFQQTNLPNVMIDSICVGMSGPGTTERDYVSMRPDLQNCAGAQDLAVLAYPSDKAIALTKADVYFPNSTDYSGFTAPDAGWFYVYLSADIGNGAQIVITPPDNVERKAWCRSFRQYRGGASIRIFAPVQKGCHVGYAAVGTASKVVFQSAHFRYAVGTAPED